MTDKRYKPIEQFIPNAHQKMIFDDYLVSGNSTITGDKFGITRQRVHQIVNLFGYKKPPKYRPSKEERKAARLANQIKLFWSRVDKKSENECWEWKNSKYLSGYGHASITIENEKLEYAHRIAWIFSNGEIPEGMNILHTCDNPPCCNPSHLYLGTQKENCRDRDERFYQNGKVPIRKKYRTIASKRELPAEIYPQEPE